MHSRRIFRNLGITLLEILELPTLSAEEILTRVEVTGREHLLQALAGDRGVIIVSAHLGSWETGLQYVCCMADKPVLGVAKKIRLGSLDRWVLRTRTRFGLRIIYKKGALPEMRRLLRRGGVLGLLVDQSRKSEGVDATFFGHRVTVTPAAAFLAVRCNSLILPVFCTRKADGRLTMAVHAPLAADWTGDLKSDVQQITQAITDVVEKAVRENPDQWFWVHKRWKKYYPHLYPEYQARRERRREKKSRHNQI